MNTVAVGTLKPGLGREFDDTILKQTCSLLHKEVRGEATYSGTFYNDRVHSANVLRGLYTPRFVKEPQKVPQFGNRL